jgi:hypothetical protein
MWDGVVEVLYGDHEQFWALLQDGSLRKNWVIARGTGCTIRDGTLKCSPAHVTQKPLDRPEEPGGIISITFNNQYLVDGCLDCRVEAIIPDSAGHLLFILYVLRSKCVGTKPWPMFPSIVQLVSE